MSTSITIRKPKTTAAAVAAIAVGTFGMAAEGWKVENPSAAIVPSINSFQFAMTAKDGILVEIRVLVSPPDTGSWIAVDDIFLVGESAGGQVSSWELNPVAVGGFREDKCYYEFPKNIVKGVVTFLDAGPTLRREQEGGLAILEFNGQAISTCLGFVVPETPGKSMTIRLGGVEHPIRLRQ